MIIHPMNYVLYGTACMLLGILAFYLYQEIKNRGL